MADLRGSRLANPLNVNVTVIAGRGQGQLVLIQLIGKAVASGGQRYQTSAAGFVDAADTAHPDGAIWGAIERESMEEADVAIGPGGHVLGLCRETGAALVPGLCVVHRLDEVPPLPSLPREHDPLETEGFEWWPWRPTAIAEKVASEGGWSSFKGLGGAAVMLALIHSFGDTAVAKAMARRW